MPPRWTPGRPCWKQDWSSETSALDGEVYAAPGGAIVTAGGSGRGVLVPPGRSVPLGSVVLGPRLRGWPSLRAGLVGESLPLTGLVTARIRHQLKRAGTEAGVDQFLPQVREASGER